MIALLQRVSEARVVVEDTTIAAIGQGLLVLVGVQAEDDSAVADRQLERLLNYRVFADEEGKMNLSLRDVRAVCCWCRSSRLPRIPARGDAPVLPRPRAPEHGEAVFAAMVAAAATDTLQVEAGRFGADMQVHLINDGPVTFILD